MEPGKRSAKTERRSGIQHTQQQALTSTGWPRSRLAARSAPSGMDNYYLQHPPPSAAPSTSADRAGGPWPDLQLPSAPPRRRWAPPPPLTRHTTARPPAVRPARLQPPPSHRSRHCDTHGRGKWCMCNERMKWYRAATAQGRPAEAPCQGNDTLIYSSCSQLSTPASVAPPFYGYNVFVRLQAASDNCSSKVEQEAVAGGGRDARHSGADIGRQDLLDGSRAASCMSIRGVQANTTRDTTGGEWRSRSAGSCSQSPHPSPSTTYRAVIQALAQLIGHGARLGACHRAQSAVRAAFSAHDHLRRSVGAILQHAAHPNARWAIRTLCKELCVGDVSHRRSSFNVVVIG